MLVVLTIALMMTHLQIGVGIAGEEGIQAVMASDFVVGRFKFLKRLLLLHGFWCYDRIARMILYFFYKNTVSLMARKIPYRTKFSAEKFFFGQNFRHQVEISAVLSDEIFHGFLIPHTMNMRFILIRKLLDSGGQNFSVDKTFRLTKFSAASQIFGSFDHRNFVRLGSLCRFYISACCSS